MPERHHEYVTELTSQSTKVAGDVSKTTIGSLGLRVNETFGYWFDFGDDWWHRIKVLAIADEVPTGKYPRITERVGQSPPQYMNWEEEEEEEDDLDEGDDEAEEEA